VAASAGTTPVSTVVCVVLGTLLCLALGALAGQACCARARRRGGCRGLRQSWFGGPGVAQRVGSG